MTTQTTREPAHVTPAAAEEARPEQSTPWTPDHHASVNKTKPIRLLEMGEGPHGKNARFEFPEGWQRTIDLPTHADGWHPLFNDLPEADRAELRRHVDHPVVTGPDGTRTQSLGLSFTTRTVDKRGRWLDANLFDVPAEDWNDGHITGYRCAGELLAAMKRGYGPYINTHGIIAEAAETNAQAFTSGVPARCHAGRAFMLVVEMALQFLARHGQHGEFIAQRIEEEERERAFWAEKAIKDKAAFVKRMRKARAAKRARLGACVVPV